jgi:hypothetical protein
MSKLTRVSHALLPLLILIPVVISLRSAVAGDDETVSRAIAGQQKVPKDISGRYSLTNLCAGRTVSPDVSGKVLIPLSDSQVSRDSRARLELLEVLT